MGSYNGCMAIRKLGALLVNQIAAGEVIDRPASVVKELVENCLDAGATRVEVHIEEGGRELIRVRDDGHGIAAEELEMAVESHATSKIESVEDLEAIATMGFRGEALASIASVSRMRLTSRMAGCEEGAVLEVAGDERSEVRPMGCAYGTVMEVRNLFFNTPARRKFMRASSTEFGHINDTLTRLAMAHCSVGFKLSHGERVAFDVPLGQGPGQRVLGLLGKGVEEGMLEFESDERGVRLWGMAGLPSLARRTSKFQYVFVNGRTVRDRHIAHAMKEAYRGLVEPASQPMVVLFVTLDPAMVDVNVHPTKAEVRFADQNAVHGQVLSVIRQRLLATDLVPSVNPVGRGEGALGGPEVIVARDVDIRDVGIKGDGSGMFGEMMSGGGSGTEGATTDQSEGLAGFVNYFRRMDPKQKGMVYQEVKREMAEVQEDEEEGETLVARVKPAESSILQVHNSYLVAQDDDGIVIIDQHALHERMMFESLYERVMSQGKLESQRLLSPVVLELSASQMAVADRLGELLDKLGMDVGEMGPGVVGIHAFPTLLFDRGVEPAEFLNELIDRAEGDDFVPSDEAALHEVLDMMSCKAAVKAGEGMSGDELEALLTRRREIERASNCPHGRPTTIRLTLNDLEKHFKRT